MVLPSSIFLSFLISLVRGGRFSSLANLRFKGLHFLAVAVIIRILLALPPVQASLIEPALGDLRYGGLAYIVSLLMALLTLLSNIHLPGLRIIALGMAANFLVIAANLGQMPGALDKLAAAGYTGPSVGHWSNFTVMGENTLLGFLGDNFLVGRPWPLPSVLSLGDLVIIAGVFWFFQKVMTKPADKTGLKTGPSTPDLSG